MRWRRLHDVAHRVKARFACAAIASVLLISAFAERVRAQDDMEMRPSLQGERFNIDFVVGPVLGSGRLIGLAGAYTALGDGIAGASRTPAVYANRTLYDLDWFEYDVTADLVPASIRNSDFDSNGESGFEYGSFVFFSLGGSLTFGSFGAGVVADFQSYELGDGNDLSLTQTHFGVGYGFLEGQLVIGVGARTVGLSIIEAATNEPLVDLIGAGPEAGAVLALDGQPFRIGAALRLSVESDPVDVPVAASLALPEHVRLPWELALGLAWQLGPRPLNRRFVNPHEEESALRRQAREDRARRIADQLEEERLTHRIAFAQDTRPPQFATSVLDEGAQPSDLEFWKNEAHISAGLEREIRDDLNERADEREREVRGLSRRYILISSEVFFIGPTERGVGLESFLSQRQQRSGEHVSIGTRLGIEGEPIAGYVRMRAGSYFEPSRFAGVGYRVHGTLGTEIRLFSWDLFGLVDEFALRFGASADVAERYLNVGVGLGFWH